MTQVAERLSAYLPGWNSYSRLAQTPTTFKDLDSWLRYQLRANLTQALVERLYILSWAA